MNYILAFSKISKENADLAGGRLDRVSTKVIQLLLKGDL